MTFRTTFRETLSSRQIALIDLPCTKNARRIFAIVSTISIPTSASIIMEASVDPQPRGPDWMPITPKTGSLFHAETQIDTWLDEMRQCAESEICFSLAIVPGPSPHVFEHPSM